MMKAPKAKTAFLDVSIQRSISLDGDSKPEKANCISKKEIEQQYAISAGQRKVCVLLPKWSHCEDKTILQENQKNFNKTSIWHLKTNNTSPNTDSKFKVYYPLFPFLTHLYFEMIYLESSRVQYGPLGIETRDPIITEREKKKILLLLHFQKQE